MSPLFLFVPLLLIFEFAQLIISERYLGKRQIELEVDPRTLGLSEWTAFFWTAGIFLAWLWMVLMLFQPLGRVQAFVMIVVTVVGFIARRNCGLGRVLVYLVLEGALRVGMLLSLIGLALRQA